MAREAETQREAAKKRKMPLMAYGESTTPEMEAIATQVVDAAYHVHLEFGPGLLESAYERCLAHELEIRGLMVRRQVVVPVRYRGLELDEGFRLDLLVNDLLIVEVKAVQQMSPIYAQQLKTYLRLMGLPLGLLINFNVSIIKDGIKRVIWTRDR